MSTDRPRRRARGPVPAAVTTAVAGTAAIMVAAVLVPDRLPTLVPPGEPAVAQTAYRVAVPPSSRTLVCPDLGSAGRVAARIDVARAGTGGRVDAVLATAGGGAPAGNGAAGGDGAAGVGAAVGSGTVAGKGAPAGKGAVAGGPAGGRPPATGVLGGVARRGHLDVPGAAHPPVVLPPPAPSDLAGIADLAPSAREALSALRSESDAKALTALAALSPEDRAGLAGLAAAPPGQPPPGLAGLAQLSAADRAGLMRLAVSSGRPVALRGAGVAGLSATVTVPGAPAGPVRDRCGPTAGWSWFAGPGTDAGHDPLLFLANLGSTPARLAIHALAPGRSPTLTEVAVPPGETVSRRLATDVPEAAATVVGVEVRSGRVSSWLVDRPGDGDAWAVTPVPGTAGPARTVLVGPVLAPSGAGGASTELVVAAPAADARIRVRLVTASGRPAVPTGLDAVAIPAGEVRTISLTVPRGEAVGIHIDAAGPAPVIAGLRLSSGASAEDGADGPADGSNADPDPDPAGGVYVAGTVNLPDERAARDAPPVPAGAAGALLLAAPVGAVTVRLEGRTVTVAGGRTTIVPLPADYAGGTLSPSGGPLGVTEALGRPTGGSSTGSASGDPAADGAGAGAARLRSVSSVLPVAAADPVGPAVLVAAPAAAR